MQRKKYGKYLGLLALVAVVAVSGVSAYFTATDTATNNFDVKEVKAELTEPNYTDEQMVVPNQTIVKDPIVTNTGTTDEFVFLSVKVPYKEIKTANADGTRNAAQNVDLFVWNWDKDSHVGTAVKDGDAAANLLVGTGNGLVNDGWTLVRTNVAPIYNTGDGEKNYSKYVEYIYAYGTTDAMEALEVNESTPALFNNVTMCNAIEGQGLESTRLDIIIDVYAIQSNDLVISQNGTTDPSKVLDVFLTQNEIEMAEDR